MTVIRNIEYGYRILCERTLLKALLLMDYSSCIGQRDGHGNHQETYGRA